MTDEDALLEAVRDKVEDLQQRLFAKVQANLSGDVLQTRSGALKSSVAVAIDVGADQFAASISSDGVAYAAIQEYGGHTAAHDIVPVKARALAFASVGGTVFARRIHHSGSVVPARAPFGNALEALRAEIGSELKRAIAGALGAN